MDVKLVVIGGETKVTEFRLKLPTVIGRGRDASLTLPHPLVSRQHCELFEQEGQLAVRDLGSLNGTFVGEERITETVIPPGELLTVGTVTFRAVYGSAAENGEVDEHAQVPASSLKATRSKKKDGTLTSPTNEDATDPIEEIVDQLDAEEEVDEIFEEIVEEVAEAAESAEEIEEIDDLDFESAEAANLTPDPAGSSGSHAPSGEALEEFDLDEAVEEIEELEESGAEEPAAAQKPAPPPPAKAPPSAPAAKPAAGKQETVDFSHLEAEPTEKVADDDNDLTSFFKGLK